MKLREDLVGFFQRFLRADVEPGARHAPGMDPGARVEPLHEAAGLVGIVALGEVLLDERDGALGIKVKRDADERARRVLWLFLEGGDAAGGIGGNGTVFFYLFE